MVAYEDIVQKMYENETGEKWYLLSDDEKAEYYNEHYYEAKAKAET